MNSIAGRLILTLWLVAIFAFTLTNGGAAQQGGGKQTIFLPLAARTMPFIEPALADYLLVGKSNWYFRGDMFTLRADSSAVTRVAAEVSGYGNARFSPDGEWITYVTTVILPEATEMRVMLMRRDGAEARAINPVPFLAEAQALWSSTGEWLLVRGDARLSPAEEQNYPLYLVSAQDPSLYRLIVEDSVFGFGFSPDGRYMHFHSRDEIGRISFHVAPVAGGAPVMLSDTSNVTNVVWHPDSRELFFSDYHATTTNLRPGLIAAADGSTIRTLYEDGYTFQGWIEGGTAALLRAGFDDDHGAFYTIPRAGGAPTPLSDLEGTFTNPSISPYGDALLYTVVVYAKRTATLYWQPLPGAPVAVDSCTYPPDLPECVIYPGGRDTWAHDGSGVLYFTDTGVHYLPLDTMPPNPRPVYPNPRATAGFLPGSTRYAIGQVPGYPPPHEPYPFVVNVDTHEIQGLPYPDGMTYTDWRYLPE